MVTSDIILKALTRPRSLRAILTAVDPGGREDTLQTAMMTMREKGQVRFDIKKGLWSRF